MDEKDKKLLSLLRSNARLSTSELARMMGLSRTTVQDRIGRLEDRGIIAGYTLRLGEQGEYKLRSLVMIKIKAQTQAAVVARIKKMPEVLTLYTISGDDDMVAQVAAMTTAELDAALDELAAIDGVERTRTSILLTAKIER